MNIFIIPSWYPSSDQPHTGVFFKEQALIYARHFPEDVIALSHWGPNRHVSLIERSHWTQLPGRWLKHKSLVSEEIPLAENCIEYYHPAFTWTRRIMKGNIDNLVKASFLNLERFESVYGKVDIVHAHVGYPAGFVAMQLAQKRKLPFVITEHMAPFPFASFKTDKGLVNHLFEPLNKADLLLAVSESLQVTMGQYELESQVFHNYIDNDFFFPKEPQSKNGIFTYLNIGRLEDQKNQSMLLEAMPFISENIHLRIAGDGELRSLLGEKLVELNLENRVKLLGTLTREEVLQELQDCDGFVLSSDFENFPVAVMEALSCGKPVVATDCGGTIEMLNKKNGVIVPVGDIETLEIAMQAVSANRSKYRADTIRSDFIKHFGSKMATLKLREAYERLIKSAS